MKNPAAQARLQPETFALPCASDSLHLTLPSETGLVLSDGLTPDDGINR
jgi:hypothetical protein